MPKMYNCITIRMVRNKDNSFEDDLIKIYPRSCVSCDTELVYTVVYSTPSSHVTGNTTSSNMNIHSKQDLYTYIKSLLTLLNMDDVPFKHIQFDLPLVPSVLITPEKLDDSRYAILTHLKNMIENGWPENA